MSLVAILVVAVCLISGARSFQSSPVETSRRRHAPVCAGWPTMNEAAATEELKTSVGTESTTRDLPPLLQDIVDERREFELQLGTAMDSLRKDYPNIFHRPPNFSIYDDEISVVDPSGVQLSGLSNYKHSFSFLRTFVGLLYNVNLSGVQYRMVYDFARSSIRVSWNAVLVPKVLGNRRNSLYVDGISIYRLDRSSGKIVEHHVENVLINNIPVRPPYGDFFTSLRQEIANPIPVGATLFGALKSS